MKEDEISGFLEVDASTRVQRVDKEDIQVIVLEFLDNFFSRHDGSLDFAKINVILPHRVTDQVECLVEGRKNNHLGKGFRLDEVKDDINLGRIGGGGGICSNSRMSDLFLF